MKKLLQKFENTLPEIIFEWHDKETNAEGWIVINSLKGGAAGGGTRMRKGLDKREVIALAKTMEVKFSVSGPNIGGAKSGINFDPQDSRKKEVLKRWYKAIIPLLKSYYGTGGDMNVNQIEDVIPITESYGLWHPQEGVVNGHYSLSEKGKIPKISRLKQGVSNILTNTEYSPSVPKYTVADMITGFGVAESIFHYYKLWGGNVAEKKVIIQGWGTVGSATAYYLAKAGAKIVGIIDRVGVGGLINENGYSFKEVTALFLHRNGNNLTAENMLSFEEVNNKIWNVKADIFIPAASSRILEKDQLKKLIEAGLKVISSGANVPFKDPDIFYGKIGEYADSNVSVIPDFIANCGMARVFAYLMIDGAKLDDESIFNDVSAIIGKALTEVYKSHKDKTGIAAAALQVTVSKLL